MLTVLLVASNNFDVYDDVEIYSSNEIRLSCATAHLRHNTVFNGNILAKAIMPGIDLHI